MGVIRNGACSRDRPYMSSFFQTFPGIEKSELAGLILILLSAKRDEANAPASDPPKARRRSFQFLNTTTREVEC